QGRIEERQGQLALQHLLQATTWGDPADAVARRHGLRKRAAVDGVAAPVQRHEWPGTLIAEVDVAVDVVLDQGYLVPGEQVENGQLLFVGHGAAERIVEA